VGRRRAWGGRRYVVVNADEGEPGTIKDRYVKARRPHLLNDERLVGPRYLSLDSLAPLFEERREENADQEVPALTAAWAANDLGDEVHDIRECAQQLEVIGWGDLIQQRLVVACGCESRPGSCQEAR
jgi:hypothetical protein